MSGHWRLLVDVDRRGGITNYRTVCPNCWPAHVETSGRTSAGSVNVSALSRTLVVDDQCYWCTRTPTREELADEPTRRTTAATARTRS